MALLLRHLASSSLKFPVNHWCSTTGRLCTGQFFKFQAAQGQLHYSIASRLVVQTQLAHRQNHPTVRFIVPALLQIQQQKCLFRTSSRRPIHPLILLLIRPLGQATAIITGRYALWQLALLSAYYMLCISVLILHCIYHTPRAPVSCCRLFRNWWRRLPEDRKQVIRHRFRPSGWRIAGVVCLLVAAGVINYYVHIQQTPITGRERFIAFTPDQFHKIAAFEFEMASLSICI